MGSTGQTMEKLTKNLNELSEQIYQQEQRYYLAKKASLFGIWDWNLVNDDLYWDRVMFDLFQPKEWDGKVHCFFNCLHPEDKAIAAAKLKEAEITGLYDYRYRVITRDGEERFIRGRGSYVEWDSQGKPTRIIGVCFLAQE